MNPRQQQDSQLFVDAPLEPVNIPAAAYSLLVPIEYGGQLIRELIITDDLSPADMRDIDLDKLSEIGEISKSIAVITKQPVELIESLKMPDWSKLAKESSRIMGNFLQV